MNLLVKNKDQYFIFLQLWLFFYWRVISFICDTFSFIGLCLVFLYYCQIWMEINWKVRNFWSQHENNTQNFFSILILNRRLTKIYFSGLNRHGDVANNTAHWSNADKEEVNLESGLWENGQPNLNDGKCGIAKKNGKGLLGNCLRKLPFVCKTEAVLKGLLLRISYTNDRYLIRYISV